MNTLADDLDEAAEMINTLAGESGWNVCHRAAAALRQMEDEIERLKAELNSPAGGGANNTRS